MAEHSSQLGIHGECLIVYWFSIGVVGLLCNRVYELEGEELLDGVGVQKGKLFRAEWNIESFNLFEGKRWLIVILRLGGIYILIFDSKQN